MTGFELPLTARISVCMYKIKQYRNNEVRNLIKYIGFCDRLGPVGNMVDLSKGY